jgi:phage protein D
VINIGGQNVSSNVLPRLTQLTVVDKAGETADTARLEIDDKDGLIKLPEEGLPITILLGDQNSVSLVFEGVLDEVTSTGSNSGRMIDVSAKSFDTKGKAKEPQQKHWDDKDASTVMKEAGQKAGFEVEVDQELGASKRTYWAMQNESFVHFGERMAREMGGTFKIVGKKAVLAKRGGGTSAGGAALASVACVYGQNLLSWSLSPTRGRPRFKKARERRYDKKAAKWIVEDVEIQDDAAEAEFMGRYPVDTEEEGKKAAGSRKTESEHGKGGGTIVIDGTTTPQPEGMATISGARPGIDGTYRIETVTHQFSDGGGWTTSLEVNHPQGGAGTDSRETG